MLSFFLWDWNKAAIGFVLGGVVGPSLIVLARVAYDVWLDRKRKT